MLGIEQKNAKAKYGIEQRRGRHTRFEGAWLATEAVIFDWAFDKNSD